MPDRIVTLDEARRRFDDLVDRAHRNGETTMVVDKGELVARIVPVEPRRRITAGEFAELWQRRPRLTPEEADALAEAIEEGRRMLLPPRDPWE